ncbi:MAG: hypothetical protein CM1200mP15_01620 [Dehalococcoidia bacterium]|nr:MAG: hypothetical protein CM1200mP15_01620 [Dehalococcoidia bacterium]
MQITKHVFATQLLKIKIVLALCTRGTHIYFVGAPKEEMVVIVSRRTVSFMD